MKKISRIILALFLFAVVGAPAAHAGTITLGISGADTGVITLTETGNNTLITAISGTFDGSTIGTLLTPGGIGNNDNLFFTPPPYLDNLGVSFSLTTPDTYGFSYVELDYYGGTNPPGPGYYTFQNTTNLNSGGSTEGVDAVTPASVPEPGTVCLTLIGVGTVFAMQKRMSRRAHQAR